MLVVSLFVEVEVGLENPGGGVVPIGEGKDAFFTDILFTFLSGIVNLAGKGDPSPRKDNVFNWSAELDGAKRLGVDSNSTDLWRFVGVFAASGELFCGLKEEVATSGELFCGLKEEVVDIPEAESGES